MSCVGEGLTRFHETRTEVSSGLKAVTWFFRNIYFWGPRVQRALCANLDDEQ